MTLTAYSGNKRVCIHSKGIDPHLSNMIEDIVGKSPNHAMEASGMLRSYILEHYGEHMDLTTTIFDLCSYLNKQLNYKYTQDLFDALEYSQKMKRVNFFDKKVVSNIRKKLLIPLINLDIDIQWQLFEDTSSITLFKDIKYPLCFINEITQKRHVKYSGQLSFYGVDLFQEMTQTKYLCRSSKITLNHNKNLVIIDDISAHKIVEFLSKKGNYNKLVQYASTLERSSY